MDRKRLEDLLATMVRVGELIAGQPQVEQDPIDAFNFEFGKHLRQVTVVRLHKRDG